MKKKSIGTNYSMCVQPTFIIGTYNEDNSPNFAPITWVSVTCEGNDYLLVISMFGTKKTKQNVLRTKSLTVNLASTDMLNLVDYFGRPQKGTNKVEYSYERSKFVSAPILDLSRWIYECEVVTSIKTGASDTFFCKIKNIQIDNDIEIGDTFEIDLTKFDPIIYSGQYHSIGKNLGKIGDFLENKIIKTTTETSSSSDLLKHLDGLHTTELGIERIKRNLSLDTDDVVAWCKDKINSAHAIIARKGKNWYVNVDDFIITINAHSYTIITAHRENPESKALEG